MQNGLGIEEDLDDMFPEQRILGAIAFICCNRAPGGVVKHLREGFIRIGELDPTAPLDRAKAIARCFTESGVECAVLESLAHGRWEKLAWNIPFNGLGALLYQTTDQLLASRQTRDRVEALMREVIRIANAINIDLGSDLIDRMIQLTLPIGPYKTSMQIDRETGRPMEIDAIIGRPLGVAKNYAIETPVLRDLYATLLRIQTAGES
jgi:2-dehydropantoate 2-reductase